MPVRTPATTGPEPPAHDVHTGRVRASYDAVAEAYHEAVADELEHKPLDRALIDGLAAMCTGRVRDDPRAPYLVLDVGCGPGHVMRHLHSRGLAVRGVDLSPAMVAVARRVNPHLDVRVGSALDLPYPAGSFSGVLSLYSIIHLSPQQVPDALSEYHRVLAPEGVLLLAFHDGNRAVHVAELFGQHVDLDGYLFDPDSIADVRAAGFEIEARLHRGPHAGLELDTDRTYLLARRGPAARATSAATEPAPGARSGPRARTERP